MSEEVSMIEWKYGMVILGWEKNGKNVKMVSLYNNVDMEHVKISLINFIEEARTRGEELILIGESIGGVKWDGEEITNGYFKDRTPEDQLLNLIEGKKLLQLCEEQGLRILIKVWTSFLNVAVKYYKLWIILLSVSKYYYK